MTGDVPNVSGQSGRIAPMRRHPLGFALHLYHHDATFRGFTDLAVIGAIVLAFLAPPSLPRLGPDLLNLPSVSELRDVMLGEPVAAPPTRPTLDRSVEIDRSLFNLSPPEIHAKLNAAADAFNTAPPSRVLDLLHGADPRDPNVATMRGIATMALSGGENVAAGMKMLETAAVQGHRQAMRFLGFMHLAGPMGVDKDINRGRDLLEDAANAGDLPAARFLGHAYIQGLSGLVDPPRAVRYLRMAADDGDRESAYLLSNLLVRGTGVAKNETEAAHYARQAAEAGHVEAQVVLGGIYLTQYMSGAASELAPAVEWLSRAAQRGDPRAMLFLGNLHAKIARELPLQDQEKGAAYYRQCAALRFSPCHIAYAEALDKGAGVAQDPVLAYAHYTLGLTSKHTRVKTRIEELEMVMTAEQLSEARRLAAAMRRDRPASAVTW